MEIIHLIIIIVINICWRSLILCFFLHTIRIILYRTSLGYCSFLDDITNIDNLTVIKTYLFELCLIFFHNYTRFFFQISQAHSFLDMISFQILINIQNAFFTIIRILSLIFEINLWLRVTFMKWTWWIWNCTIITKMV